MVFIITVNEFAFINKIQKEQLKRDNWNNFLPTGRQWNQQSQFLFRIVKVTSRTHLRVRFQASARRDSRASAPPVAHDSCFALVSTLAWKTGKIRLFCRKGPCKFERILKCLFPILFSNLLTWTFPWRFVSFLSILQSCTRNRGLFLCQLFDIFSTTYRWFPFQLANENVRLSVRDCLK